MRGVSPRNGSRADDAFLRERKRERAGRKAEDGADGRREGRAGGRGVINFEPVKTARWVTRD